MTTDPERIQRRIDGRRVATVLISMLDPDDLNAPVFMEAFREEIQKHIQPPEPEPEPRKVEPIARLGATVIPFGKFAGKTFDDADLEYLDWLCREQESFYSTLRDYLRHPDLESRRRGLDR